MPAGSSAAYLASVLMIRFRRSTRIRIDLSEQPVPQQADDDVMVEASLPPRHLSVRPAFMLR